MSGGGWGREWRQGRVAAYLSSTAPIEGGWAGGAEHRPTHGANPPGVYRAQALTFGAIGKSLMCLLGVDVLGNLCERARNRVFSRSAAHMKPGSADHADLRAIGALRGVMGALVDDAEAGVQARWIYIGMFGAKRRTFYDLSGTAAAWAPTSTSRLWGRSEAGAAVDAAPLGRSSRQTAERPSTCNRWVPSSRPRRALPRRPRPAPRQDRVGVH